MSRRRVVHMDGTIAPPPERLAAVVAVGTPRYVNSEVVMSIAEFAQSSEDHKVGLMFEATPNRMDWSYSRVIDAFLKADAEWLLINDADVLPSIRFDEAYQAVTQDFAKGFAVIASPCMNTEGRFSMRPIPMDGSGIRDSSAFECEFITGGHWWIHESVVKKLPVVSQFKNSGGGYENLYLEIPKDTTEDADMCRRFRKLGFRIAADPRLLTDHLKIGKLPSYRRGMPPPTMFGATPVAPMRMPSQYAAPTLTKRLEGEKPQA